MSGNKDLSAFVKRIKDKEFRNFEREMREIGPNLNELFKLLKGTEEELKPIVRDRIREVAADKGTGCLLGQWRFIPFEESELKEFFEQEIHSRLKASDDLDLFEPVLFYDFPEKEDWNPEEKFQRVRDKILSCPINEYSGREACRNYGRSSRLNPVYRKRLLMCFKDAIERSQEKNILFGGEYSWFRELPSEDKELFKDIEDLIAGGMGKYFTVESLIQTYYICGRRRKDEISCIVSMNKRLQELALENLSSEEKVSSKIAEVWDPSELMFNVETFFKEFGMMGCLLEQHKRIAQKSDLDSCAKYYVEISRLNPTGIVKGCYLKEIEAKLNSCNDISELVTKYKVSTGYPKEIRLLIEERIGRLLLEADDQVLFKYIRYDSKKKFLQLVEEASSSESLVYLREKGYELKEALPNTGCGIVEASINEAYFNADLRLAKEYVLPELKDLKKGESEKALPLWNSINHYQSVIEEEIIRILDLDTEDVFDRYLEFIYPKSYSQLNNVPKLRGLFVQKMSQKVGTTTFRKEALPFLKKINNLRVDVKDIVANLIGSITNMDDMKFAVDWENYCEAGDILMAQKKKIIQEVTFPFPEWFVSWLKEPSDIPWRLKEAFVQRCKELDGSKYQKKLSDMDLVPDRKLNQEYPYYYQENVPEKDKPMAELLYQLEADVKEQLAKGKESVVFVIMSEDEAFRDAKFILAEGDGKTFLVSSPLAFHVWIKRHLEYVCGFPVCVRGGGRIRITEENKTMLLHGASGDFGYEPRDISISVIKENLPEWEIKKG